MTHREQYPGSWAALVNRLVRLEDEITGLRSRALRVPVIDADPVAEEPANLWAFSDKRLRVRLDDGAVMELLPPGDNTTTVVKTYATNPALGSGVALWLHGGTGELRARLANGTIQRFTPQLASTSSGSAPAAPASTSTVAKPQQAQPVTYRRTYDAAWTQTYTEGGSQRTSDLIYYGRLDEAWGEQKSMLGFPDVTIRSDLAGSTVTRVELWLSSLGSYFDDGVVVHIGGHASTDKPASYTPTLVDVSHAKWGKYEAAWRNVSRSLGRNLRDDVIRGLVLDQPGTSSSSYGYAVGTAPAGGGVQPPRLRITYVK